METFFFIGKLHMQAQWFLNQQPHPPPNTYKGRRCQLS